MAIDENMSRENSVNGVNHNVNVTGIVADAANILHVAPAVQDNAASIGNASSAPMLVLLWSAQAMVVMMDSMRPL